MPRESDPRQHRPLPIGWDERPRLVAAVNKRAEIAGRLAAAQAEREQLERDLEEARSADHDRLTEAVAAGEEDPGNETTKKAEAAISTSERVLAALDEALIAATADVERAYHAEHPDWLAEERE